MAGNLIEESHMTDEKKPTASISDNSKHSLDQRPESPQRPPKIPRISVEEDEDGGDFEQPKLLMWFTTSSDRQQEISLIVVMKCPNLFLREPLLILASMIFTMVR